MPRRERIKLSIYVDPGLAKWLRRERAETTRSVSEIASQLMLAAIAARQEKGPPKAGRFAG